MQAVDLAAPGTSVKAVTPARRWSQGRPPGSLACVGWFRPFDNDLKFGGGHRTTKTDGSWSVTRDATDHPNVDNIRVKSRNLVTGETCLPAGFL